MVTDFKPAQILRPVVRVLGHGLFAACLLFSTETKASGASAGQDSITVDGVPLILSLSVSEEAGDGRGEGRPSRPKRTRRSPEFSASLSSGAVFFAANVAGVTVARFAGRGLRPVGDMQGRWTWSGDRMSWRVGLAWSAWSDVHYDTRQLEDSLYALDPDGQGGIRQLTRQTYDLGIELDTVPLTLDLGVVQSTALSVEWKKSRGTRRRSDWSLWGGAWARVIHGPRGEGFAERVPESGLPDSPNIQGNQRGDWVEETTWGLGAFATLEKAWNKQWSSFIRLDIHAGQRQHTGFRLGLTRHFRRS